MKTIGTLGALALVTLMSSLTGCGGESAGEPTDAVSAPGDVAPEVEKDSEKPPECETDADCAAPGSAAEECVIGVACVDGKCALELEEAGAPCGAACAPGTCDEAGACQDTASVECQESDGNPCTVPTCVEANGACVEVVVADGQPPYASTDCWEGAVCTAGELDVGDAAPSAMALECQALATSLDPFGCVEDYVCIGGQEKCKPVLRADGLRCWPTKNAEEGATCHGFGCESGACVLDGDLDSSCGPEDLPTECGAGCAACTTLTCHWIEDPSNPGASQKVRYCKPTAAVGQACASDLCLDGQACGLGSQGNGPLGKETLGDCSGGAEKTKESCLADLGMQPLPCLLASVSCDSGGGGCAIDQANADKWCYPPAWKCFDTSDTYCTHLNVGPAWDSETGCQIAWVDLSCNDENDCTVDSCLADGGSWSCEHKPVDGAACDDGQPCTSGDLCEEGTCKAGAPACADSDDDPCNDPGCDVLTGDCLPAATDGLACDDGNPCTVADACTGASCAGGAPKGCDDGNPCTDDLCDPASGCIHEPNSGPCDDGSAATVGDQCGGGACIPGSPIECGDGNPCTNDLPDATQGCIYVPNFIPCDDENACTANDTCAGGLCVSGPPPNCDDGNFCTIDTCESATGCTAKPATNGIPCPGGPNFVCADGVCGCQPTCDGTTCGADGCGSSCACDDPDTACVAGTCQPPCQPFSAKYCYQKDLWWFDSCDEPQEVFEVCADDEFCTPSGCKPKSGGTDDSSWDVTANPSSQTFLEGLGTATFLPMVLDMSLDGSSMTGQTTIAGLTITYSGTKTGDNLTFAGSYTDPSGFSHVETWNVSFASATGFSGTMTDAMTAFGLPLDTLNWNVTGVKK